MTTCRDLIVAAFVSLGADVVIQGEKVGNLHDIKGQVKVGNEWVPLIVIPPEER